MFEKNFSKDITTEMDVSRLFVKTGLDILTLMEK